MAEEKSETLSDEFVGHVRPAWQASFTYDRQLAAGTNPLDMQDAAGEVVAQVVKLGLDEYGEELEGEVGAVPPSWQALFASMGVDIDRKISTTTSSTKQSGKKRTHRQNKEHGAQQTDIPDMNHGSQAQSNTTAPDGVGRRTINAVKPALAQGAAQGTEKGLNGEKREMER